MKKTVADYPELVKQWHPTKNGDLTPEITAHGSDKKVWWKCDKADDHEWEARVANRTINKSGCPCCHGSKAIKSNCLSTIHPELIEQWHPIKNGNLTPEMFTHSSDKKIWWKCDEKTGHEWEARIANRTRKRGCPYCVNKKVCKSNCLSTTHPELVKQWHPTKNGNLTPEMLTYGSTKKVWWKCNVADDHEWRTTINSRTGYKSGCPCCVGQKVVKSNCLSTTHPKIAKEWHSTKNGNLTPEMFTHSSHKKIWWQCNKAKDHKWEAYIYNRTGKRLHSCPCCDRKKVVKSNCLSTTHPQLAKQWHPAKNNDLTANMVTAGSDKKVWWQCNKAKDHEWKSRIANRTTHKRNCPYCNESKGEKEIENILKKKRTKFQRQYSSASCKNKIRLRFDFIIWHKSKMALIEYQGEQHYTPMMFGGSGDAKKRFAIVKKRDKIKRQWCKKNNIPLLEIPYWDFDKIKSYINDFVKHIKTL